MFGAKSAWGVEIGSTSLKAVKLSLDGGQPKIVDWFLTDYPGLDDGEEARQAAAAEALRAFVKSHRVRASDVVAVAVPGRAVFAKFIKLPPVEKKRIPEIVKYESRQQIPFPIDDVVWDYQPAREETPPGEEVEVGIFAVRREIVQEKMGLLYQAGLRPTVVQGGNLALFNYVTYGRAIEAAHIVVDMGAEASDFIIVHEDRFWLRNLPTGGQAVTKRLQERLQIPFKDAERLKREAAHSKQAEKLLGMMRPAIAAVLREIQLSLGFYKSQHEDVRFAKFLLTGRGFLLKGLPEAIHEGLKIPLARLGPSEAIAVDPAVPSADIAKAMDRLGVPLGLALQGLGLGRLRLNLVPPEVLKAQRSAQRKPYAVAASLFVFLAVLVFYLQAASTGRTAQVQDKRARDLLQEVSLRQDATIREVRDDEMKSYMFVRRLEEDLIRELRNNALTHLPHDAPLDILHRILTLLTPRDVWIDGIQIQALDHPRAGKPDFPAALPRRLVRVTLKANTYDRGTQAATFDWINANVIKRLEAIPRFDCTPDCYRLVQANVLTRDDVKALAQAVERSGEGLAREWGIRKEGGVDYFNVSWFVMPSGGDAQ